MKKTTIILLCVLLLTVVTLTSVFATAGSAELAASASTAKPGETVEFVASLADFPEADAISVTVTASEGLTVQSGEWILGGFVRDYNNSQKIGIWGSTDTVDLTDKTDVFKLICQVKEPAVGQQNLSCEVTVTFRVMSNDELQGNVTATKTVTVSNPATGLELNKQSVTLDLSGTKIQQLTATVTPENTTDALSWSSDDNTVATVSPQGEVTAVSEGTATITATVGSLTKTCTVTVSCSHAEKTAHPANSSTCQQNGNNLYYTCDVCGDAFKADQTTSTTAEAEKLPLEDHQGGEASCSQQAKCKWCQQPYGNTLPHKFTEKIEDAAHFVAGSGADCQSLKQYYFDCADCDAIGTTTFNSTTYGEHQMSTQWTSENDTHFHKCTVTGCTHTEDLDDCSGGTATCEDLAVCTTCQKEYGQLAACDFTAQNPNQEYLVSGATCTAKAVYHVSCSVCGAEGTDTFTYGDFADHDFSEKIEDAAHFVPGSGADCQHLKQYYFDCANCTAVGTTTFNSTTYGAHNMSTQWTSENDTHFHKCTVAGCAHKEDTENCSGGTATCTQKAECDVCQQPYGSTLPHDFSEKIEDAAHFVADSGADCQSLKQYYFDCADCNAIGTTTFNSTTYGAHQMSTQWTSENDTHFHKCTVTGCTHTEDLDDCSGGTATCKDKAVCATCQQAYGQLAACDFTAQIPTQEYLVSGATCTAKAVYHVSCSVCGAEGTDTFTYGDFADHDFSEKIEDAAHFVAGSGADCQHLKQYYFDCANCTTMGSTIFNSTTYGEHQMSTQWTSENDTHFHKCIVAGCTHKEDTENCSGGTATCTQKAECDVCQQPYGSTLPHNYSQQWSVTGTGDTDKHYYLCASCQVAKDSEGTHSFAWVVDSHPTEDDTGMKHEECSVCHVKRSEGTVMDKLPHQHIGITHYPEVKANCQSTGTLEYWTCSSPKCANIYYGDQNFETKLTDIVIAIDPDNHLHTETRDQLAANCYEKGYTGDIWCLDCSQMAIQGSEIPATGNHVAGAEFHTDESTHWHICITTGCGAEVGKTEHAYQWKVDSEATEDVTGIKHEECVCGVKRNENTVIEKLDHVHVDIVHHKAVKATCVSEGTVEYWTCSSPKCEGKYYGDEECQSEISELTEQINKDNHAGLYVKGRVEATCSENGYTGDTWCSKCGASVRKGEIALATGKHTSEEDYLTDKDAHWHVCDCGEIFDKDTHTLEVVDAKEATQTEAGYTGDKVCSVCGYVAETGEEIPVETQPTEETQPQTKPESGDHDSSDLTVPVVIAVVVVVALAPAIVLLKKRIK